MQYKRYAADLNNVMLTNIIVLKREAFNKTTHNFTLQKK